MHRLDVSPVGVKRASGEGEEKKKKDKTGSELSHSKKAEVQPQLQEVSFWISLNFFSSSFFGV